MKDQCTEWSRIPARILEISKSGWWIANFCTVRLLTTVHKWEELGSVALVVFWFAVYPRRVLHRRGSG